MRKNTGKTNLRRILFIREQGHCFWCEKPTRFKDGTIDHLIAKARGGQLNQGNTVYSCSPCNRLKSDKDPFIFLYDRTPVKHIRPQEEPQHGNI